MFGAPRKRGVLFAERFRGVTGLGHPDPERRSSRMPATQIATLHTSAGDIRIELFGNHAPKTVKNFVDLATGGTEWTHPETRVKTSDPLYNGTVFHRVIDGFMIQGGDPLGEGYGGPGYKFGDEF